MNRMEPNYHQGEMGRHVRRGAANRQRGGGVSEEKRGFPWHRLIMILPFMIVVLWVVESRFIPGDDFFNGKVDGFYALYKYQWEIASYFASAVFYSSVFGLVVAGMMFVFWRSKLSPDIDVPLGLLNLLIAAACILLSTLIIIDFGNPFMQWHVAT